MSVADNAKYSRITISSICNTIWITRKSGSSRFFVFLSRHEAKTSFNKTKLKCRDDPKYYTCALLLFVVMVILAGKRVILLSSVPLIFQSRPLTHILHSIIQSAEQNTEFLTAAKYPLLAMLSACCVSLPVQGQSVPSHIWSTASHEQSRTVTQITQTQTWAWAAVSQVWTPHPGNTRMWCNTVFLLSWCEGV